VVPVANQRQSGRDWWHRQDTDRHGRFYSYPLSKGRWAIRSEESDDPVSC
jgi:hypothetical protein